jgi:hypothetical protein
MGREPTPANLELLRQAEEASTCLSQLHQCQWVEQGKRDVLGQFKLPAILLQIGGFEAA